MVQQLVEVDLAVFKYQKHALCLKPDHDVPQTNDVGMIREHFEYLYLSQRGDREAILIVKYLHLLDCQLLVTVLILGVEDYPIRALTDHFSLLKLPDEPAIESVHISQNYKHFQ